MGTLIPSLYQLTELKKSAQCNQGWYVPATSASHSAPPDASLEAFSKKEHSFDSWKTRLDRTSASVKTCSTVLDCIAWSAITEVYFRFHSKIPEDSARSDAPNSLSDDGRIYFGTDH